MACPSTVIIAFSIPSTFSALILVSAAIRVILIQPGLVGLRVISA